LRRYFRGDNKNVTASSVRPLGSVRSVKDRVRKVFLVVFASLFIFGMGAAFSSWRKGELSAWRKNGLWSSKAPKFLSASEIPNMPAALIPAQLSLGSTMEGTGARTPVGHFKQFSAPPTLVSLSFSWSASLRSGIEAESAAFDRALRGILEERERKRLESIGISLYSPAIPWEKGTDEQTINERENHSSLLGSACGRSQEGYNCTYHAAPGGRIQCCCSSEVESDQNTVESDAFPTRRLMAPSRRQFTCLPSIIVAGAQKSGTTALIGYLLSHPAYRPSIRKEVHYFDKYMSRGLPWYISHMPPIKASSVERLITGEASPSYQLGVDTARQMASLLPHAKIVTVLREPATRSFSEWNMKLRRVKRQIRHDKPETIAPILELVNACLEEAWAPFAPILFHAAHITVGEEFSAAVSSGAGLKGYSSALQLLFLDSIRDERVLSSLSSAWQVALGEGISGRNKDEVASSASSASLASVEQWSTFVSGMEALAAGRSSTQSRGKPLAKGSIERRQRNAGSGVDDTTAENKPLERAISLLKTLFNSHWTAYGRNATGICLKSKVLVNGNGLASLLRFAPHAPSGISQCLLDKLSPSHAGAAGERSADGGNPEDWRRGLESLFGFVGEADSAGSIRSDITPGDQRDAAEGGEGGGGVVNSLLAKLSASVALYPPSLWPLFSAPATSQVFLTTLAGALAAGDSSNEEVSGLLGEELGSKDDDRRTEGRQQRRVRKSEGWVGSGLRGKVLLEETASQSPPGMPPSTAIFHSLSSAAGSHVNPHLVGCFMDQSNFGEGAKDIQYESVGGFKETIEKEIVKIEECSVSGIPAGGVLAALDGATEENAAASMNGSGSSILNDGTENCWKAGSNSNIVQDFVYRSVYLRQIHRLHAAYGRVSFLTLSSLFFCNFFPTGPTPYGLYRSHTLTFHAFYRIIFLFSQTNSCGTTHKRSWTECVFFWVFIE